MIGSYALLFLLTSGQDAPSAIERQLQAQSQIYEKTRPSPVIHFSPRAAAAYAVASSRLPLMASLGPDDKGECRAHVAP